MARKNPLASSSINRIIRETLHHLQDNLDCWVAAVGKDDQSPVFNSYQ